VVKYCIRFSLPVLLFVATFVSCSEPAPPNLDSWVKKYTYSEDPVSAGEDFLMVMSWDLAISKSAENKYVGELTVNGQQTAMTIAGDVTGDQQSIAFIYTSSAEGTANTFQPGDTLFMLKKSNNSLITQWHAATPRLRENPPATCNCFQ
jgi:hypothetical protein